MKERKLIYKETSYSEADLETRLAVSRDFAADPRRIQAVRESNLDPAVLDAISNGIKSLDPRFAAWTDVAEDEDGIEQTRRAYRDAQVSSLPTVFGSGAALEAKAGVRSEILAAVNNKYAQYDLAQLINLFESREGYLPDVDRLQVLDVLQTRLVLLVNSNPRVLSEALKAAKIYRPIKHAIGGEYEDSPNGLPWVFSASGYNEEGRPDVNGLNVLQGWSNYSPLADLNPKSLQVYGLIGTATEVHRILFEEAKKIQFSSRFAGSAAEHVLRAKLLESVVWAVPDFVKRYAEDEDFRILADTVLRLVARESWIAYSDGFGNLVGQERYDQNKVAETVGSIDVGKEAQVVIGDQVLKPVKVSYLTEAVPGRLCIYLNGEDTRHNFNIVVPWVECGPSDGKGLAEIRRGFLEQGLNVAYVDAELTRVASVAVARGESILRFNARNLVGGPQSGEGAGVNGLEVRVLPAGSSRVDEAVRETRTVNSVVRNNLDH